jgi:pyrimidine-nucleoside phosphorylase
MLDVVGLIVKKREGGKLSSSEIHGLVAGFVDGKVPDYQMSAWLMAAYLRGLDARETTALTEAMLHSGRSLPLASVGGVKVDKHSTGGVGDKVSICLAPAAAAAGVFVPMIAGRGLGHTGGTLDKLEAIPGYRTRLSDRRFEQVVARVGCSIIGQSEKIAPADRLMYALRDVTGTVESIPLIVASILSKKLAVSLDGLVLDVKAGKGAFMGSVEAARELGRELMKVGRQAGAKVRVIVTDMDAPIGKMIGNALEVVEAIDVLRNAGPPDTVELTVELGAEMCRVAGVVKSTADGRRRMRAVLSDGTALTRFAEMVEAHGGDPKIVDATDRLPRTRHRVPVLAGRGGYVEGIDSKRLGLVTVNLGAGRARVDQAVDHAVGIEIAARVGDRVDAKAPLAWLHVRRPRDAERWAPDVRAAFYLQARAQPVTSTRIIDRLT